MTTYTARGVPLAETTDAADIAARLNPVAQLIHDRPGVSAVTTAERDALTPLWDGRLIINTTLDKVQRYDLGTTSWVSVADNSEILGLLATTGLPLSDAATASRGTATTAARSDHVHPRVDSGWIAPTLLNGWVNYDATWEPAGYRRLDGITYLRGLVRSGTTTDGTAIFNVPAGYRASSDKHIPTVSASAFGIIKVWSNGNVGIGSSGSATWFSLANVSFPADL